MPSRLSFRVTATFYIYLLNEVFFVILGVSNFPISWQRAEILGDVDRGRTPPRAAPRSRLREGVGGDHSFLAVPHGSGGARVRREIATGRGISRGTWGPIIVGLVDP